MAGSPGALNHKVGGLIEALVLVTDVDHGERGGKMKNLDGIERYAKKVTQIDFVPRGWRVNRVLICNAWVTDPNFHGLFSHRSRRRFQLSSATALHTTPLFPSAEIITIASFCVTHKHPSSIVSFCP